MKSRKQEPKTTPFATIVGRALRRSAKKARQLRMHGTRIWIWKAMARSCPRNLDGVAT